MYVESIKLVFLLSLFWLMDLFYLISEGLDYRML